MPPKRGSENAPNAIWLVAMIHRGGVGVACLNPNQGARVGKLRQVVVIQANPLTEAGLASLLVAPLATQRWQGADGLCVPSHARDGLL